MDNLIDAADRHAEHYKDDPRPRIGTDVRNAFFSGALWSIQRRLERQPRWTYVASGSEYAEIARGKIKVAVGDVDEWVDAVFYQAAVSGRWYARSVEQFEDGRFALQRPGDTGGADDDSVCAEFEAEIKRLLAELMCEREMSKKWQALAETNAMLLQSRQQVGRIAELVDAAARALPPVQP